jgi:hypothetical protein
MTVQDLVVLAFCGLTVTVIVGVPLVVLIVVLSRRSANWRPVRPGHRHHWRGSGGSSDPGWTGFGSAGYSGGGESGGWYGDGGYGGGGGYDAGGSSGCGGGGGSSGGSSDSGSSGGSSDSGSSSSSS